MMDDVANYYAGLLIVQYNNKPKARETIYRLAQEFISDNIFLQVQNGFDLETAVGKQLDILGEYIGVNRAYNGTNLTDEEYRFILKLKIVQNNSNHSEESIDVGLQKFFGNQLFMTSNNLMQIRYYIVSTLSNLGVIAFNKGVLPKPMGVRLQAIIKPDVPLFAFSDVIASGNNYFKGMVSVLTEGKIAGDEDIIYLTS